MLSLRIIRAGYRLAGLLSSIGENARKTDMAVYAAIYRRIWEEAARELRAEFTELSDVHWKISRAGRQTVINNYRVGMDNPVILDMAGNKSLCYTLMQKAGLPVPAHETYALTEFEKALRFMEENGPGWFVVKPARGTAGGRGVTTHVATPGECMRASALASLYGGEIMIEKLVPGESYRFLVLDGEVIHVSRRRGLRVAGDGKSTVRALVEAEALKRGLEMKFASDRDLHATLKAQGLYLESVPGPGEEVIAKSYRGSRQRNVEVCTSYDEDATRMVCEEMKATASKAAGVINSSFAGVDIITLDPRSPLERTGGAINEINTTPGLHNHYGLENGNGRKPAVKVLRRLLDIGN